MESTKIYEKHDSSKGFYRGSRLSLIASELYDTRSTKSMKIHEIHENL
jgi:hypothetical protein